MKFSLTIAVALTLLATLPAVALQTDKDSITFNSLSDSETINLTRDNGQPIAPKDIKSVQLMASGHDYSNMIKVDKQKGKLTVAPGPIEIGTYQMVINTTDGQKTVQVNAPLSSLPGHVENIAARQNVPAETVRRNMGLVTLSPRSYYEFKLPATYYQGQTLEMTIPGDPDATYRWTIDGKVVKEGRGATSISHTWTEPGDHVVSFEEIRNGVVSGSASDTTNVQPMPPMATRIPANTSVRMDGPDGYGNYAWLVNGSLVSTDKNLDFRITEPGDYLVEVVATEPLAGQPQGVERMAWHTTVTPRPEGFVVAREYDYP